MRKSVLRNRLTARAGLFVLLRRFQPPLSPTSPPVACTAPPPQYDSPQSSHYPLNRQSCGLASRPGDRRGWFLNPRRCAYRPVFRNRRGRLPRGCRYDPTVAVDFLLVAGDRYGGTTTFLDRVAEKSTRTPVWIAVTIYPLYIR